MQQYIPVSLRSVNHESKYIDFQKNREKISLLDEPTIREWQFWVIIDNAFPYDYAFKVHHMLLPKREVTERNISEEESKELLQIYEEISDSYDCRLINFTKKQSVKNHFHVHLLIYKDKREELQP